MRVVQRRTILGLLGLPYLLFGLGKLRTNERLEVAPDVEFLTNHVLSWVWIVVGLYAVVAMFHRGTNTIIEEVGYGLLFIPPFAWMTVCIVTLFYSGSFFIYSGFITATTIVVLILYLARYMRNG
jgi:muconolactone delta-isomerase